MLIAAKNFKELNTAMETKGNDSWNIREILYAVIRGKTNTEVFFGVELSEEELAKIRKKYIDAGFTIISESVQTTAGGDNREPLHEIPARYRAIVSWE